MRTIKFLPIVKEILLAEYDPRMAPEKVFVWVNPPRVFLRKRDEAIKTLDARNLLARKPREDANGSVGFDVDHEAVQKAALEFNEFMYGWYAELLSQGEDPETHFTADEVRALQQTEESDPNFFPWLIQQTARKMRDHRSGEKKS